ncbi:MAG: glycosyltransferase family 39 protein [Lachnospiraceae bacterium]|nr:glycosyltransferase family 39 protein [Lachnospiraceae bacterium]
MKEQRFVKILTCFYLVPFALMIGFNIVNSLLRTTYFELYQVMETAKYKWDNPVLVLLVSVGILFLFYWIMKSEWMGKRDVRKLMLVHGGSICLFIVLLFRCVVTCDSGLISDIAVKFLEGNYEAFVQGQYLYMYPFQIGLAAVLEFIYLVFGIENFIVFELLNIISILVILDMLGRITRELFEDERICRIEALLSMGMFPLFLFSTFVYGDIIGWAFGIGGIYLIIRYLKTGRWQEILKTSLLLSVGIIIKSNINILVVAAVIAVTLRSIGEKKYKMLLWTVGIALISQAGIWAVSEVYALRAGLEEYPQGIPKIAWIAMSMQQGDEGGYACGWYNSYNWNVYSENNYDQALATQACVENLKQSLGKFLHEQRYALDYFYKKFTSQWNAPTFQAMITNEWNSRHVENLSPLANFFIYGAGRNILYGIMNIYHFLMFLCTGVYCWFSRKSWSLEKAYFTLNIFGGFLFHMIWEAQSRYILGYFVLMLPLAAFGLHEILKLIDRMLNRKDGEL